MCAKHSLYCVETECAYIYMEIFRECEVLNTAIYNHVFLILSLSLQRCSRQTDRDRGHAVVVGRPQHTSSDWLLPQQQERQGTCTYTCIYVYWNGRSSL